MKRPWLLLFPLLLIVIIIISAAGRGQNQSPNATDNSGKLKVAASFMPVADMVSNIGGDRITVIQILPKGASPHTYEPEPADIQKLSSVNMAFVIGSGLDDWAKQMLTDTAPGFEIVTLDQGITLRKTTTAGQQTTDPHYWLSLTNASIMCREIFLKLTMLDPADQVYFQNNLDAYLAKIATLQGYAVEKLGSLPNKQFITFHAAFNYFATDFGLQVVASIEEFPGTEPTPQYLANVGKLIQQYHIKTLFKEPELSDTIVSALANDYGATVATLDPEGSLHDTYLGMMQFNIDTVAQALQ
jgi:ABC-type Zn uptake system ZnuABC Zn-binding protein ZnuA